MQRDFKTDWLPTVDNMLRSMGYTFTQLDEKSWRLLYDNGLSPFDAVSESEFDGTLTWEHFKELQKQTKRLLK